jgi:hypothetical protein
MKGENPYALTLNTLRNKSKPANIRAKKRQNQKTEKGESHMAVDLKKLLEETKDIEVEDGRPLIVFNDVGDSVAAKFVGLRSGIKTKKSNDATAIDMDVLEGNVKNDEGVLVRGECTAWASTHLHQIFNQPGLKPGDIFILRLASVNPKSGFKKFYFQKVSDDSTVTKSGKIDPKDDLRF